MYDQIGHDNFERMDSTGGDPSEGGFGGGVCDTCALKQEQCNS